MNHHNLFDRVWSQIGEDRRCFFDVERTDGAITMTVNDRHIPWAFRFLPDRVEFTGPMDGDFLGEHWTRWNDEPDVIKRIGEELINLGLLGDEWPQSDLYQQ